MYKVLYKKNYFISGMKTTYLNTNDGIPNLSYIKCHFWKIEEKDKFFTSKSNWHIFTPIIKLFSFLISSKNYMFFTFHNLTSTNFHLHTYIKNGISHIIICCTKKSLTFFYLSIQMSIQKLKSILCCFFCSFCLETMLGVLNHFKFGMIVYFNILF